MARLKLGSIVSDISGKVGTEIYSRNKGGPYVKSFAVPSNPESSFRTLAESYMAAANGAWQSLSDSDYEIWSSFTQTFLKSSFGSGYKNRDPRDFYISCFINRKVAGLSGSPSPVMPQPSGFLSLSISIPAVNSIMFNLSGGSSSADFRTVYYGNVSSNLAVRSFNTLPMYRLNASNYTTGSDINLSASYLSRLSISFPSAINRVFGMVRIIHSLSGIEVGSGRNTALFTSAPEPFQYGPTFTGGSNGVSDSKRGLYFAPTGNGQIETFNIFTIVGSSMVRFALYSGDDTGPDSLIFQTSSIPAAGSNAWTSHTLPTPYEFSAGDTFWLCYSSNVFENWKNVTGSFLSFASFDDGIVFNSFIDFFFLGDESAAFYIEGTYF